MGLTFKISGDSFALFPSTLIGTLPVALALANSGTITGAQASLSVMLPSPWWAPWPSWRCSPRICAR